MGVEHHADLAAPRRGLWLAALVVAVAGAGGVAAVTIHVDDHAARGSDRRPPPRGAFATGGRPRPISAPLRRAFAEDLPSWLVALGRERDAAHRGDRAGERDAARAGDAARAALEAPALTASLGGDATAALHRLLARAHAAAAATGAGAVRRAADALAAAATALDDALATANWGLFLDTDVITTTDDRRAVLVYTFTVEHVSVFTVDGDRFVSLHLRRLDPLNWTHRLLGFTSRHMHAALILLDQIDELAINTTLPALAPGGEIALIDHGSLDDNEPWQRQVQARGGAVIRAEYTAQVAAVGGDADALAHLGTLLAARQRLLRRWEPALAARGLTLATPRTLALADLDLVREAAADVISPSELDDLDELERALAAAHPARLLAAVRAVAAAAVEQHELQHRVDTRTHRARPIPAALRRYLGAAASGPSPPPLATLARDELSAYMAALARDERTPRTSLTLLARFLFDRAHWGSAECYAAVVILDELARELAIAPRGPLVAGGAIVRRRVAAIYLALTDLPAGQLRAAAARLFTRLTGRALPRITRVDARGDARSPAAVAPPAGSGVALPHE